MSDELKKDLRSKIAQGNVVIIVGAGVSMAATKGNSLASWTGLLEHGVKRCLDVAQPLQEGWEDRTLAQIHSPDLDELLSAAEMVSLKLGWPDKGEWNRWLRETVGSLRAEDSSVLDALVPLRCPLATTNYDSLLSDAMGLEAVSWRRGQQVYRVLRAEDRGVLHLHGFWKEPKSVVLGIRSYEEVLGDSSIQNLLHALRTVKTLLFVGCGGGLQDPNFHALRTWSRKVFASDEYRHYRLCLEQELDECRNEHPPEERIFPLAYGKSHEELVGFLESLALKVPEQKKAKPKSASSSPEGLPPVWRCFGRNEMVEELVETLLMDSPPPIPVLGAGGMGKTTVALMSLRDKRVAERFRDRRYFVRCEGARGHAAVLTEIAREMGLRQAPDLQTAIFARLADEPAALLLDNADTPWECDTQPFEELLSRLADVPKLALVVTVRGEVRPPGPPWRKALRLYPLEPEYSKQAFLSVAGEDFKDDPHLDQLLVAVDHVPLAVVLLAYQAEGLKNLSDLWQSWQKHRTALLKHSLDQDNRLSNIEVSLDLSIMGRRMNDTSRRLLSLLGLLPDGISKLDLEVLFPKDGDEAARMLLRVGLAYQEGGRTRLLAPTREHVRLHHPPQTEYLSRAVEHFIEVASMGSRVGWGEGARAVQRLLPEFANLESILSSGFQGETWQKAVDASYDLGKFTFFTGVGSDRLLRLAINATDNHRDLLRKANCIKRLGDIALWRSDHDQARQHYEEALPLYREVGDQRGEANCIQGLGDIALWRSDHDQARQLYDKALLLYREVGDVRGEANRIQGLGEIALRRSDHDKARQLYNNALQLYRQVEDILGEANCIRGLGDIALERWDHDQARQLYDKTLPLYRQAGALLGEASSIKGLGDIALRRSDHDKARQFYDKALQLYIQVRSVLGEANCIQGLGDIGLRRSDHDKARQLYYKALPLFRQVADVRGEANCIRRLGDIALVRSDHDQARRLYDKALTLFRQIGYLLGEANSIHSLGDISLERSAHHEARQLYEKALPLFRQAGSVLGEANCIKNLGDIALRRSDHDRARQLYDNALQLYRQVEDMWGEANCFKGLGDIALELSDHDRARQLYDQTLQMYRQVGSVLDEANCIKGLGDIALERLDHDQARQFYDKALQLYRQVGSVLGEANCIKSLGDIALWFSDHDQARQFYDKALPLFRQVADLRGEANCIRRLGDIALWHSDYEQSRQLYDKALPLFRQVGFVLGEANCIYRLAEIALGQSDYDEASQRYQKAMPLYRQLGSVLGEANCIAGIGDIALQRSDYDEARQRYTKALKLYQRIPEPNSIGWAHRSLARLAQDGQRRHHAEAAQSAWQSIGKNDLVKELEKEFPELLSEN